jgi:hypothetical protein
MISARAAYPDAMAEIFHLLQQYIPTKREGGPDTSKPQTKVEKGR